MKWSNYPRNHEILISENEQHNTMINRPKTSQVATRSQLVKNNANSSKTPTVAEFDNERKSNLSNTSENRCTSMLEKSRNLTPFGNRPLGGTHEDDLKNPITSLSYPQKLSEKVNKTISGLSNQKNILPNKLYYYNPVGNSKPFVYQLSAIKFLNLEIDSFVPNDKHYK